MSNIYLGQILMFGGNFAPRGFAFCNGQFLSISQNAALFSLVGTTYGGNGTSNFALPNMQSSVPLHMGQGLGLSSYELGQAGGTPAVTLIQLTMPNHSHTFNATAVVATGNTIANNSLLAQPTVGNPAPRFYVHDVSGQPPVTPLPMNASVCGPAGGSQPHSNLMPSVCVSFIIALVGIFPSRN
ncbi:MAG TPA: tail fiber protein [Rhizomicrobium sp.]